MKRHIFPPMQILAMLAVAALAAPAAKADAGHDHGDAPPAASGDGPRRLPDGSVFLPKPAQRQFAVRTLQVAEAELPRAFELAGRVMMDPDAGGKVQAALAGRIEARPNGLPRAGQSVRKGEVLAYVVPSAGAIERANQLAQRAELRAARSLAEKRLARLRELSDTVPRKEIEAAESEVESLAERLGAVAAGLGGRDALAAPVSGVIASAHAVAGQVVEPGELVFEVVDPRRLQIEALAYDVPQAQGIAGAFLGLGGERVPLRLVGTARSLRDQALPVTFSADGEALQRLAVGQPVQVVAHSAARVKGVPVPLAALTRNPANQDIVWVKERPEHFVPRTVRYEPLDGTSVAVTSGLGPGERVVVQGAAFVNQVR
ncbi:efflux RND transporter periplasmic adaptor subunit [Thauera sinica]|uniref:Efflux RND transporter periplasmic adaptor subunit n=1 Tax=Thauera sinica TaxID=2665146 RepID=A0ABW1AL11_9RHOO|nr:HlyD family efflux transporter periplasmic adaptor subunit [Thauera sp. K11]ATE62080.1 hypothetical protein CCZ27_20785 [Thauera sp. K11]